MPAVLPPPAPVPSQKPVSPPVYPIVPPSLQQPQAQNTPAARPQTVVQPPRRMIVTNPKRNGSGTRSKFRQAIPIFFAILGFRLIYMLIGGLISQFGGTHVDNHAPVMSPQQMQTQLQQDNERYTLPTEGESGMYLGLNYAALTNGDARRIGISPGTGIVVSSVVPGSPAAEGHIAAGDIIEGADGHTLDSTLGIDLALSLHTRGQPFYGRPMKFKIYRGGAWWDVTIHPVER